MADSSANRSTLRVPLYSVLLIAFALIVSGCAPAPTKKETKPVDGIYFEENASVDPGVRKEFAAAINLLHEEKYQEGIKLLKEVIKGSQNNSAPYINIAIAYGKLGDDEKAEENLKQALEINPEHPVANNEYALLYRRTGRFAEARQLYEKVIKQYPDFMPARKNLGILCDLYLNDAPCALEQYEIYSKAYPDDKDMKIWIAGLKQRGGK